MRADWKWEAKTDQVTGVADSEDIVVEGAWEVLALHWVAEDDDTSNNPALANWNQSSSLVGDLGTLAIPREEHSAAWALSCSTIDLTGHVFGTGVRAISKVSNNISKVTV